MLWMVKDFDSQTKEKAGDILMWFSWMGTVHITLWSSWNMQGIITLLYLGTHPTAHTSCKGLMRSVSQRWRRNFVRKYMSLKTYIWWVLIKVILQESLDGHSWMHSLQRVLKPLSRLLECTHLILRSSQRSRCNWAYRHPHGACFLCHKPAWSKLFSRPWAATPQPHLTYLPQPMEDQPWTLPHHNLPYSKSSLLILTTQWECLPQDSQQANVDIV